MPSIASSLLTTLLGVISQRTSDKPGMSQRLEDIRQSMLDSLADAGATPLVQIERRVMFASDAESLWYLRPDLLMVIASKRGERAARQKLEQISAMFIGLLPKGLNSRQAGFIR